MTLAELIQEVYTITNRPDRSAETLSAIKSATLKAHQCDFFWKDLFETGVQFSGPDFLQQLDYRSVLPLWRANKYLRKFDFPSSTPGKFLTIIQPEQVLDAYKCEKDDIYYYGGTVLNIKSSTLEDTFLYGCYVNPDITSGGYNSWIALDHPYAIIFDAAGTVFKAIGKDEEAATYKSLVPEQLMMLKTSNIIAQGT